jgi:hypothetical protein
MSLGQRSRSKTTTCIEGFQYNFAQMFTFVRQSVARKNYVPATIVKVTHESQNSDKNVYSDYLVIINPLPVYRPSVCLSIRESGSIENAKQY